MTWQENFWAKVDKTGGCWLWTGHTNDKGYGMVRINNANRRCHRISFEMSNGPIPDGMLVDHRCHTPACLNPAHLRLATPKQNMENRAGPTSRSKSGARGVAWNKNANRWAAHVTHNKVNHYLGYFNTVAEAEAVVIAKRLELFTHNDVDRKAA